MSPAQRNKPARPGSGETVPSKEFANWVAPIGASLPSAYFEGSPESAILSRTNFISDDALQKTNSRISKYDVL